MPDENDHLARRVDELQARLDEVAERLARLEARELGERAGAVEGVPGEAGPGLVPASEPQPETAGAASTPGQGAGGRTEERLPIPREERAPGSGSRPAADPVPADEEEAATETPAPAAPAVALSAQQALRLTGRAMLVLGGAFVLRAVTEAQLVGTAVGALLGLAYALGWVVASDRLAGRGELAAARFYLGTSMIIGFPLLWETTARFHAFPPAVGIAALLVFAGVLAAVGVRRSLPVVAFFSAMGALAVAVGIGAAEQTWALAAGAGLVVAAGYEIVRHLRRWAFINWCVGLGLDLLLAMLTLGFVFADPRRAERIMSAGELVGFAMALLMVYLGGPAWRAVLFRKQPRGMDTVLGGLATVVGLGGGILTALTAGRYFGVVGVCALAGALTLYGVSFATVGGRESTRRSFLFFSTFALALAGIALPALLGRVAVAVTFSLIAVIVGWLGARYTRATLSGHAALYCACAAWASGLLLFSTRAWIGPGSLEGATPMMLLALAACLICTFYRVPSTSRTWGRFSRAPKVFLIGLASLCLGGLIVLGLLDALAAGGLDPGGTGAHAVRTVVIAAAAVLLAWLGRFPRFRESRALSYPILIVGGVKLVGIDLPMGSALAAVASLVGLGTGLIVCSRLLQR